MAPFTIKFDSIKVFSPSETVDIIENALKRKNTHSSIKVVLLKSRAIWRGILENVSEASDPETTLYELQQHNPLAAAELVQNLMASLEFLGVLQQIFKYEDKHTTEEIEIKWQHRQIDYFVDGLGSSYAMKIMFTANFEKSNISTIVNDTGITTTNQSNSTPVTQKYVCPGRRRGRSLPNIWNNANDTNTNQPNSTPAPQKYVCPDRRRGNSLPNIRNLHLIPDGPSPTENYALRNSSPMRSKLDPNDRRSYWTLNPDIWINFGDVDNFGRCYASPLIEPDTTTWAMPSWYTTKSDSDTESETTSIFSHENSPINSDNESEASPC